MSSVFVLFFSSLISILLYWLTIRTPTGQGKLSSMVTFSVNAFLDFVIFIVVPANLTRK